MSRILKDLMTSSHPQQDGSFSSEPRFNPLAGSSERPPVRPWRTGLLILAYALVVLTIAWQGWQLASRAFTPVSPADTADHPVVVPEDTDVEAARASEAEDTAAPAEIALEPLPESQLAPIALPQGTADLPQPPLVEPEPPAPDSPPEDTALSGTGETALSGSGETALSGPEETALSGPEETAPDNTADSPTATAEIAATAEDEPEPAARTTQPDIASVSDPASARQGVQFSDTGRNRALNQAQALHQSGREEEALMQLAQWLRQDDHTDVRQYYARLLLRAERAEEARYIVRPDYNREELELRAYADFQVSAFRDSLRHYSALLDRADTIQSEWYLWLAICHDNLNETSQAIVFYQTFLDQNGNQPDSLVHHARERLAALAG